MIQACRKRKSVRDWMSWHSDCAGARRYWNRDGCCSLPYNSDVGWKCRLRSYSRDGCCRGGHWHSRDGCCATIRGAVLQDGDRRVGNRRNRVFRVCKRVPMDNSRVRNPIPMRVPRSRRVPSPRPMSDPMSTTDQGTMTM